VTGKSLSLALAAALMIGCTHARPASDETARVIIKFVERSEPPPAAFQVRMSDGATIVLRHERAMSGNAHLYSARLTEPQLTAIVEKLDERPEIDYAEADRKVGY
jgi:hypothetical protein